MRLSAHFFRLCLSVDGHVDPSGWCTISKPVSNLPEEHALQVEEEATASEIVDRLRIAGNDPAALLLMDRELGARSAEGGE